MSHRVETLAGHVQPPEAVANTTAETYRVLQDIGFPTAQIEALLNELEQSFGLGEKSLASFLTELASSLKVPWAGLVAR